MFLTKILENSASVHLLKKLSSGSRFLALAGSSAGMIHRIIAGSRAVSFLKVGDYLDVDSKPLASLVKNAENYRRTYNLVTPRLHRVRFWIKNLHLDQSEMVSLIEGIKRQREKLLTRKNILFFGLVFLAAFYILRFLLLAFIPDNDYRISWSAGLLLTLILIVLLLQLAPKNNTSSSPSSGAGVIQNTGRFFIWLAVNAGRSGKFIAEAALKFIRSRKSGGNRH